MSAALAADAPPTAPRQPRSAAPLEIQSSIFARPFSLTLRQTAIAIFADSSNSRVINYTERLTLLMQDIVARVPTLSFIDIGDVLVFARFGRSNAEGAFATCHCLSLPASEPGYYFWRDRSSGASRAARSGSSPSRRS